jgi:NADP-dependent 3-hydroxy acid dehydrogenase YdfG
MRESGRYSYKVNFLNEIEVIDFINNIKKEFEHIDVLINNAALSLDNNFKDKSLEEFITVIIS